MKFKALLPIIFMSIPFLAGCNNNQNKENVHTITWVLNYEGAGNNIVTTAKDGEKIEALDPERTNYMVDDWYTEPECAYVFGFDKGIFSDVTLYASWVESRKVTFYYNLPEQEQSVYTVAKDRYNRIFNKKPTDPTNISYSFVGWYEEAACENEFNFNARLKEDKEAYAKWKEPEWIKDDLNAYLGIYHTVYGIEIPSYKNSEYKGQNENYYYHVTSPFPASEEYVSTLNSKGWTVTDNETSYRAVDPLKFISIEFTDTDEGGFEMFIVPNDENKNKFPKNLFHLSTEQNIYTLPEFNYFSSYNGFDVELDNDKHTRAFYGNFNLVTKSKSLPMTDEEYFDFLLDKYLSNLKGLGYTIGTFIDGGYYAYTSDLNLMVQFGTFDASYPTSLIVLAFSYASYVGEITYSTITSERMDELTSEMNWSDEISIPSFDFSSDKTVLVNGVNPVISIFADEVENEEVGEYIQINVSGVSQPAKLIMSYLDSFAKDTGWTEYLYDSVDEQFYMYHIDSTSHKADISFVSYVEQTTNGYAVTILYNIAKLNYPNTAIKYFANNQCIGGETINIPSFDGEYSAINVGNGVGYYDIVMFDVTKTDVAAYEQKILDFGYTLNAEASTEDYNVYTSANNIFDIYVVYDEENSILDIGISSGHTTTLDFTQENLDSLIAKANNRTGVEFGTYELTATYTSVSESDYFYDYYGLGVASILLVSNVKHSESDTYLNYTALSADVNALAKALEEKGYTYETDYKCYYNKDTNCEVAFTLAYTEGENDESYYCIEIDIYGNREVKIDENLTIKGRSYTYKNGDASIISDYDNMLKDLVGSTFESKVTPVANNINDNEDLTLVKSSADYSLITYYASSDIYMLDIVTNFKDTSANNTAANNLEAIYGASLEEAGFVRAKCSLFVTPFEGYFNSESKEFVVTFVSIDEEDSTNVYFETMVVTINNSYYCDSFIEII